MAAVHGDSGRMQAILNELTQRCETAVSRFSPLSELSRVSKDVGDHVVSEDLTDYLESAALGMFLSGGLLDPCIGDALVGLGYDKDFDTLSESSLMTKLPRRRFGEAVSINGESHVFTVRQPCVVDLGATAKARCADLIVRRVLEDGAASGSLALAETSHLQESHQKMDGPLQLPRVPSRRTTARRIDHSRCSAGEWRPHQLRYGDGPQGGVNTTTSSIQQPGKVPCRLGGSLPFWRQAASRQILRQRRRIFRVTRLLKSSLTVDLEHSLCPTRVRPSKLASGRGRPHDCRYFSMALVRNPSNCSRRTGALDCICDSRDFHQCSARLETLASLGNPGGAPAFINSGARLHHHSRCHDRL